MRGKVTTIAMLLPLAAVVTPRLACAELPRNSFGKCNHSNFYYNDCLKDNGLTVIVVGLRIAREFLKIASLAEKQSIAKLIGLGLDLACESIPSPLKATIVVRRDLDNVRCKQDGSQQTGATTYNVTLLDQKTLHWQLQLQFVLPVKKTSQRADVFLFMRTVIPRSCPDKMILSPLTESRDLFFLSGAPLNPDVPSNLLPSTKLLWALAPSNNRVAAIQFNEYTDNPNASTCEVLISGKQQ